MPSYILSHTSELTSNTTLIQTDQELPSCVTGTFNSAHPGASNRPLQALLNHLHIEFEPDATDELIIEQVLDIATLNLDELDTAPAVSRYDALHTLSQTYDDEWEGREAVDWDQAETLVRQLRTTMTPDDLAKCPHIAEILTYTDQEDDWDSGEVAQFGTLIRDDLEAAWPISNSSLYSTGNPSQGARA